MRADPPQRAISSLTCLLGANGAGKTTTIEAISFALADDTSKFRCALVRVACTSLVAPSRCHFHKRNPPAISPHDARITQRR